jgi:hypothetical protein
MKSSATVTSAENSSEPRQPNLFEKKKNMEFPRLASLVNQCVDQRQQSLVFGPMSSCPEELSDLGQGGASARAEVRLMLDYRHARPRTPHQSPNISVGTFVEDFSGHDLSVSKLRKTSYDLHKGVFLRRATGIP